MDGATTWKAWDGSPLCVGGSATGPTIWANSTIDPASSGEEGADRAGVGELLAGDGHRSSVNR